ncbi:MAG TPA: hypothetical protein VF881_12740 [Polyangiaceae bacterium]
MNGRILLMCVTVATAACSGSDYTQPVDVSGAYAGQVTNGVNSCPGVWVTGAMADVQVTAAQSGEDVSLQVNGAAALALEGAFGSRSYNGKVSGSHIEALIIGTVMQMRSGCTWTTNGTVAADLNGNTLSGTVTYSPQTNNHADCTTEGVAGCSSAQSFTLTRP